MTDHRAQTCPDTARELRALAVSYPAFRFRRETVGRRGGRWIAERRDHLGYGVHTVITADLGELRAALGRPDADQEEPGHAQ